MSQISQTPFDDATFAENPEPRCPCILLLDTSGSMNGDPIRQLNEGVAAFREELLTDELASRRVEVAIVTFGPVEVAADFATPDMFYAPHLMASGDTPMGGGILQAIDMLERRKALYRSHGVAYFRPWIFLITDGGPTDTYQGAAQAVREGEAARKFNFFAVGVRGADFRKLAEIAPTSRPPVQLDGLKFREMFKWLSASLKAVSHSQSHSSGNPEERLNLPAPSGWTSI